MTRITVASAEEADLDSIAWALGDARDRTGAWLRWRLRPPAGPGVIVRSGDGLVLLTPLVLADGTEAWQQIDAVGEVDALQQAVTDVADTRPLLAFGARPGGSGWRHLDTLPSWATGPDPFEPLQPRVIEPDERHDALAGRVTTGQRAQVETWSGRPAGDAGDAGLPLVPARGAAWLRWSLAESDDIQLMEVADGPEVGPHAHCRGWVMIREGESHGQRVLRVLDLQASDRDAHYALLKAARKLSWERGGIPVVLHGERMSRRYAFTAGFLPASKPLVQSALSVWARGPTPEGRWRAWAADR